MKSSFAQKTVFAMGIVFSFYLAHASAEIVNISWSRLLGYISAFSFLFFAIGLLILVFRPKKDVYINRRR